MRLESFISKNIRNVLVLELESSISWNIRIFLILELESPISRNIRNIFGVDFFFEVGLKSALGGPVYNC